MSVLGVDGCRAGWVGVALGDGGAVGMFGQSLPSLVHEAERLRPGVQVVAVDMPIGLPDRSSRQADVQARRFVGPRGSSVFPTPVRAVLDEEDYATACAVSRDLTGKALSKQAHALRPRLAEVDQWVHSTAVPVIEVHPEVSFAEMAGAPLAFAKRAPEGLVMRRQLLESQGIDVDPGLWGLGRLAKQDDVLDAAAAAWSAQRYHEGRAVPVPDPPERFSDGWPSAIWR